MPLSRFLYLLLAPPVGILLANATQARDLQPLHMSNQAPLSAVFAVPLSSSAKLLSEQHSQWGIQIDSASVYSRRRNHQEGLIQDGEFTTLLLHYHMNIKKHWQLGFYLPWRYQGGGFSDSIVDGWHELFGLPEGGRDTAPKHRLLVTYQSQGQTQLLLQETGSGFMDLRTRLSYQLKQRADLHIAIASELKLNHAESDSLLGSGGLAVSIFSDINWQSSSRWQYQARFGLQYRQQGDVLPEQHKPLLWFGNLGLSLPLSDTWYVQSQIEFNSAQYDSALTELGAAAQLSFGLSYLGKTGQWDISLSEDIVVTSAPDVALHLSWRKNW